MGSDRRRTEVRRRGSNDPLPTDCCGAGRRRTGTSNAGNYDSLRRRNDIRRRSSNGWYATDYSRRRGISGSTVALAAGLGFAGGIALGVMISQPGGHSYYYHQNGFYDNLHVYHNPGYYSPTGYYYQRPTDFGYCPPTGAPDYIAKCNHNSHIWTYVLLGCLACCCIGLLIGYCYRQQKRRNNSGLDVELNASRQSFESVGAPAYGDPVTRQGQQIPRADAICFLQAVEAEYVYGAQGEVGRVFASRQILQEVQGRLECEEEAIRMSGNARGAVNHLAERWGMMGQLNGS